VAAERNGSGGVQAKVSVSESCELKTPPYQGTALDTIEGGNEWPVYIAAVVLLAVEESRGAQGDGNTCGSWIDIGD
jgi:hypothetical protein